jgi:hypothetical protein
MTGMGLSLLGAALCIVGGEASSVVCRSSIRICGFHHTLGGGGGGGVEEKGSGWNYWIGAGTEAARLV